MATDQRVREHLFLSESESSAQEPNRSNTRDESGSGSTAPPFTTGPALLLIALTFTILVPMSLQHFYLIFLGVFLDSHALKIRQL
jgi:hypothetical protein